MRRIQVKKKRDSLWSDNRGASLIAVLVAFVFVMTIAAIVLEITTTNIRMREIELSGKRNFYSAEEVMDELTQAMAEVAAREVQESYTEVLSRYGMITRAGGDLQAEFRRVYMEKLEEFFLDSGITPQRQYDATGTGTLYTLGGYDQDTVRNPLPADASDPGWDTGGYLDVSTEAKEQAIFTTDYEEGLYTLKNLTVHYTDSRGYETTISTDLVFHTPELAFEGGNMSTAFMGYALIADESIEINAASVSVDGSVYAGAGGIVCTAAPGSATLIGNNIVTRGDIAVTNGTRLVIGDASNTGATHIWAENVTTGGKGASSVLALNGDIYIADDLALNGKNSTVTLTGKYYGYNFRENYVNNGTLGQMPENAAFSSAIMINGEGSRLDLSGLSDLFLAGRTFVSRGAKGTVANSDILLGESLSVRTDQLAYYVSTRYLQKNNAGNLVLNGSGNAYFSEEGVRDYATATSVANVTQYLDPTRQVVPYWYRDNVSDQPIARYYLNFNSEKDANDFFTAYWNSNSIKLGAYGENYAEAIVLDANTMLTLQGDLVYRNPNSDFSMRRVVLDASDWAADSIYWENVDMWARTYKSLELDLSGAYTNIESADVRFYAEDGSYDDTKKARADERLINNLIDVAALKSRLISETDHRIEAEPEGHAGRLVALVDNAGGAPYQVRTSYSEGIVVVTGDVQVLGTFRGMVISGGTITFASGASVTGDENLVNEMFEEDMAGDQLFALFFKGYVPSSGTVDGSRARIRDYLSYENWTRNEE